MHNFHILDNTYTTVSVSFVVANSNAMEIATKQSAYGSHASFTHTNTIHTLAQTPQATKKHISKWSVRISILFRNIRTAKLLFQNIRTATGRQTRMFIISQFCYTVLTLTRAHHTETHAPKHMHTHDTNAMGVYTLPPVSLCTIHMHPSRMHVTVLQCSHAIIIWTQSFVPITSTNTSLLLLHSRQSTDVKWTLITKSRHDKNNVVVWQKSCFR